MMLSVLASSFRCNKFEDYICNKANLRDLIAATGLVILLKLDLNRRFFQEQIWMTNNDVQDLFYPTEIVPLDLIRNQLIVAWEILMKF